MALSLDDVQSNKSNRKKDSFENKERVLRPWETYDQLGNQTRTIQAQEAVRKARHIVAKNNQIVDELREGYVCPEISKEIDESIDKKNEQFTFNKEEIPENFHKINTRSGIVGFFRDIFRAQ